MGSVSRYSVRASKVHSIICHRPDPNDLAKSQYLLRWRSTDDVNPPLSWHPLCELTSVLDLVQPYIIDYQKNGQLQPRGQKRKLSRSGTSGQLMTPDSGRSPIDHSDIGPKTTVFNAVIERREGVLTAITHGDWDFFELLDVRMLPTLDMVEQARITRFEDAERAISRRYNSKLMKLKPPVSFVNEYDRETPSLKFKFIPSYVLTEGVSRRDELLVGCQQCRPNMGANRGCEYTKKCDCLEFAAPDESKMTEEQLAEYRRRQDDGDPSTDGLPKRFPYVYNSARGGGNRLAAFYLSERHAIYECNAGCACGPECKNRNVQRGRSVRLQVFKTPDGRGFGLRCLDALAKGQFVDTYLGEVITDEEADAREDERRQDEGEGEGEDEGQSAGSSYLFALDKFIGDTLDGGAHTIGPEECLVVDGRDMGGPTRFINHRCGDPNLQMHTVSYNKYDPFIYDLAFFACCDIPAGEELTFDYMDADDLVPGQGSAVEDNEKIRDKVDAAKDKVKCLCGSEFCRGYLWT